MIEGHVVGGERFQLWLARAPIEFNLALFEATAKAVELQAKAIKDDTPVLTGALRASIDTKVGKTAMGAEGKIYSTSRYARFVEYGTHEHGRARRMFQRGIATTREPVHRLFTSRVSRVTETFG